MEKSSLEKEILAWFARESGSPELAAQCLSAEVISREQTGTGLFIHLRVSGSAPSCTFGCAPNAPLLKSPELPQGASIDLWLNEGRLDFIEIASLGSSFPSSL
jgi:hypothetical protein